MARPGSVLLLILFAGHLPAFDAAKKKKKKAVRRSAATKTQQHVDTHYRKHTQSYQSMLYS